MFFILIFFSSFYERTATTPPHLEPSVVPNIAVDGIMPMLLQAQHQYSIASFPDGRITFTPVGPRRTAQPLRLQQIFSTEENVNMELTTADPTPILEQQLLSPSSGLDTPSPTVAFPEENVNIESTIDVLTPNLEQQLPNSSTPELYTPSPTVAFPEENVNIESTIAGSTVPTVLTSPLLLPFGPANFRLNRQYSPSDVLPIPKVPQTGPRTPKANKRLGSARELTNDSELKKLKEAHEEKQRKEIKKQESVLKKMNAQTKKKTVTVCVHV